MKFTILILDNKELSAQINDMYNSIALSYEIIELTGKEFLEEKQMLLNIDHVIIDSESKDYVISILQYLRKRWSFKHIPVLILANDEITNNAESFSNFGVVDFLQKPIDDYLLSYSLLYTYNVSRAFKTLKGENLVLKQKLIELEKLRISNISLAQTSQRLEDVNFLLEEKQSKIKEQQIELIRAKRKTEDLLLNILPEEVSRELMINGEANPQFYKKVTVMFTDFVGFTKVCENIEPQDMTKELDTHFSMFDDICEEHYLEKIKTIGDAYMCAGGIPIRNNSNPFDILLAAMKIVDYMNKVNEEKIKNNQAVWQIRIGIHTGSVVAGVIGKKKFAYDIWGDAVNTACRIETTSEPGKINISGDTYNLVKEYFNCTYRGKIYAKNKGEIDMYFLNGMNEEFAHEDNHKKPNKAFNQEMAKL